MTPRKADHRAPLDEQPFALAEAEDAGTLPEADRRAPEPEEVIESPVVRVAHERVLNAEGNYDYFTASGDPL